MTKQFLMEIGLEEMPAHLVTPTINQFVQKTETFLQENRLTYTSIDAFSTPRRLAIRINDLADQQENIEEVAKGPAKRIAQNEAGEWSKAAIGFAKGQNAQVDELFFQDFNGEDYVFINKFIKGQPVEAILPQLTEVVASLTFPISMHWANYPFKFIRPVHWLVALLDDVIVPMSLFDIKSGRISRGHRFLGKDIAIANAAKYEETLLSEFVIVEAKNRKERIVKQINQLASENNWLIPIDENLLEEVTNLVEYPTVFVGNFEEKYLSIPADILITSMKEHQRYFEVLNTDNELLNHFIGVRNGNNDDIENVAKGNAKVLKARLEDAEFFYQEDIKVPIEVSVEKLKQVTFHEKIGSVYEKMKRVEIIAQLIGKKVGLSNDELKALKEASQIYKFDLVTLMVDEFPELQGIIGEKYALLKGVAPEVAKAIREHYLPNSSDGQLPESSIGACLAIADKVDTLMTFFSVGLAPKGSNDPYALRRQAYGIIRIIENKGWHFPIESLLELSEELINKDKVLYGLHLNQTKHPINAFLKGRMKQWFNAKDIRHDIVEAVVESEQADLNNMFEIADILSEKATSNTFRPTVESLTRVINLANKIDNQNAQVDETLFENEQEIRLNQAFNQIKKEASDMTLKENFASLESLYPLIEAYFEKTMVMVEDEAIKNNRLNQLSEIAKWALSFASIDKLIVK